MQSAAKDSAHDSMLRIQSPSSVLVGTDQRNVSFVTLFTGVWHDTETNLHNCAKAYSVGK